MSDFILQNVPGGSGVVNATGGKGGFISNGQLCNTATSLGNGNPISTATSTDQAVVVFQFTLPCAMKISRAIISVSATLASGTVTCGIYDANSNKLIDSGVFSTTAAGIKTNTFTAVTLPLGVYYFAQSTSSHLTITVLDMVLNNGASNLVNGAVITWGLAANLATSGVLPATLGALSSAAGQNLTFCYWDQA